jgi:UDP-2,3-diacylglucosamine hydrolase
VAALAILAGGGRLPLLIAESVTQRGDTVHFVAIRGEAGAEIEAYPHTWVRWGQLGRMVRALKAQGGQMVIAGAVSRPDLMALGPDLGMLTNMPAIVRILRAGGDNAVLTKVITFFEEQGLVVRAVHDVAPDLLATEAGIDRTLSDTLAADRDIGRRVLAALSDLDVGQGVVVSNGTIIAIEGVDGTDSMLARLAALRMKDAPAPGGVLIKHPKTGQELRVDMPTIGPATITSVAAAGLSAIAITAGRVLILDRAETEHRAQRLNVALDVRPAAPDRVLAHRSPTGTLHLRQLTRCVPTGADIPDIAAGVETVMRLAPFNTGAAAAVMRRHVLAIAANESLLAFATRVSELRQWGMRTLRGPRGACVLRLMSDADAAVIADCLPHIVRARIAGLALIDLRQTTHTLPSSAVAAADDAGLFLVDAKPPLLAPAPRS